MTTVDKTNTHYKLQGNPITTSQDTPDNQSSRRTAKEKKGKQMSLISRSRPIPCNNPTIRGNVSFSKYVIINFSSALVKRAHRHWTGEIYDSIYAEKRSLFCIGKNTTHPRGMNWYCGRLQFTERYSVFRMLDGLLNSLAREFVFLKVFLFFENRLELSFILRGERRNSLIMSYLWDRTF